MDTEEYFDSIRDQTDKAYDVAEKAREQSKDPEQRVDIPVAEDLPEKASSLVIAAQFPELEDQGVAERIRELEDEYGKNDERVAFQIGREIAQEKFYEFDDVERACDAGVRVGASYMTGGITTAPLEGIGDVKVRENSDGSEYLAIYYSGPIRSAGGTASAMSVLLADYVRIGVDLAPFKPSDTVVKRYAAEVDDYYTRVTAKQYYPEREETEMIAGNVPVEVTGSPTEQLDVTNYKDLERVETNQIRGGMCLVYLDGLPLKAPKIKKRIEKWGKEFGLEHWEWVEDYLELQEEIHSSGEDEEEDEEEEKYTPSDKFLGSMTAGRPVFGHPGKKGGFRLRYGHSRVNGLAATSVHPATMEITERFIATGTQLKTEYPMKGTVTTPTDSIHPPIVRLEDGSVVKVDTREHAREIESDVDEILFLGDMLVTYGEFVENGKRLLPSGYVDEWWEKELEQELERQEMELGRDFSDRAPSPEETFRISDALGIPIHPQWTYHWRETSAEKFKELYKSLRNDEFSDKAKRALEDILLPHKAEDGEFSIAEDHKVVLETLLALEEDNSNLLSAIENPEDIPEFIKQVSGYEVRTQVPHYVGARMGRPEKAERRTIDGKPQIMFPCGKKEGGRMRNLVAAYNNKMHKMSNMPNKNRGEVHQGIIHNKCAECGELTHFSYCTECGAHAEPVYFCRDCGNMYEEEPESCESCGHEVFNRYKRTNINVRDLMDKALENLDMRHPPELLKSVRGMSGKHKHVEPLEKGLLRQKHDLYVNKDGTVRYDATDIPMSHFKPKEISVSIERLKEQGYTEDIDGEPLEDEDQVVALKPQDIILPDGENTLTASDYFVRVANFIDDLLEQFYGIDSYYDVESKEDLVGTLVIGLAPHTSGGTVGRIIGFTEAKGIYAHPYWHAAKRRNSDGDEDAILLLMDGLLNFSRDFLPDMTGARSITKDTRLVIKKNGNIEAPRADELIDSVLDDEGFETRKDGFEVNRDFDETIEAVSFDEEGNVSFEEVSALIRHENDKQVFNVNTSRGEISVTGDHSVFVTKGGDIEAKPVRELEKGDCIVVPSNPNLKAEGLDDKIDLFEVLPDDECYVKVPEDELKEIGPRIKTEAGEKVTNEYGRQNVYRYRTGRRDAPLEFYKDVGVVPSCKASLGANSDPIDRFIKNSGELYRLLGYLMSEGDLDRGRITNTDEEVIEDIEHCIRDLTGVEPRTDVDDREGRKKCYWVDTPATLMRALEELGLEREKFDEKIPSFVFGAEEEKIKEFITAYRAGDGSICEEKGCSKLYTKSGEMATQLALLVRKLGFKSSTRQVDEVWEVLYSEWRDKDPYWPLWELLDEERGILKDKEFSYDEIKQEFSNDRKNDRMKTVSKQRVERLYSKGLESLEKPVEGDISVERVKEVEEVDYGDDYVYDLEVPSNQNFLCGPHPIFAHNTMDAPLILSTVLNPDEVDDEAWAIETVSEYPLSFYEETEEYKYPWELDTDIEIGEDIVHSDEPFTHGYTHESETVEDAPNQSEYVTLDEMSEKTQSQLGLGEKLKAVNENEVAELLLQKHFIPDIKGNLRSFSKQKMRCVDCNAKFRRVPMTNQSIAPSGKVTAKCPEEDCDGKVLLTISEGTIKKYMQPSQEIIDKYEINPYVRQQILILNKTLQSLFGKSNRQSGLKQFTS
ncbi:MAG: DNA polymerase II large subunit [Colwellia polaris]|jgi:DNA polymerase II large subunit